MTTSQPPNPQQSPDLGPGFDETQFTFGEKLVGLNFNPSNDPNVQKAKELCAQLADLLEQRMHNVPPSDLTLMLYPHTMGEILNAQMNVVKLLTLKY